MPNPNRRVVISGCSGGGKSTVLDALAARGHAVVEEPGRRIVRAEMASGGQALPWIDMPAFARRALSMAIADHHAAGVGWTFFDRSWIDAATALDMAMAERQALAASHGYHPIVFLAPPWPEIFTGDAERRHDMEAAIAEYTRLSAAYPALGYEVVILPKVSVEARLAFLWDHLG